MHQKREGGSCAANDKQQKQAGAELGQAQPELGFAENDLSLRDYIQGWG